MPGPLTASRWHPGRGGLCPAHADVRVFLTIDHYARISITIRLRFREYKARSPVLEFRGRGRVELLWVFTRAAEQPVPVGLWEKDLTVIRAVENVAKALHRALVLLAPDCKRDFDFPQVGLVVGYQSRA
jgi:hypothetical protein